MQLNPWKIMRHRRRLRRAASEEAELLRRRFGGAAAEAARQKLERPDLTSWGREVVGQALKMLKADATPSRPPSQVVSKPEP
jgi:hypothetical protein